MLRSLWTSREGSVAVTTGFVLVLVTMACGGALDFTNAVTHRSTLQDTIDAAVLAAARMTGGDEERIAVAEHFLAQSRFCAENDCGTPTASVADGIVTLAVDARVPTTLLGVVGWDTVGIEAVSKATSRGGPLEVVLVLDYSSSMNSSNKYENMRTAAVSFLDHAIARPEGKVDIGLVPFARYVMAPMDGSHVDDVVGGHNLDGFDVVGCTLNRQYPHSISVDTPSAGSDERWPVISYAAGSEPTQGSYSAPSEAEAEKSEFTCQDYADRKLWVRPLTDRIAALKLAVNAMTPASGTNIALGLDFGWHVLSDNAPFTEAATGEQDPRQVLILLSDGEQTIEADGPYGFDTASAKDNIARTCESMKARGIDVFVIAFDVEDAATRTLLRNCASDAPFYYEPGVEDQLQVIFDGIYDVISAGQPRLAS